MLEAYGMYAQCEKLPGLHTPALTEISVQLDE